MPAGRPLAALVLAVILGALAQPRSPIAAAPDADRFWNVDDIRAGMRGHGKTVLHGTKLETFQTEVLGVLKNTSPGRDMVLCRLSGLDLERTGVIAGMSGSPVYIDGKLLGAVAFAWPFGKEPLAGVTPITQMIAYADTGPRHQPAEPVRLGLARPLTLDGRSFDSVTVAQTFDDPSPADGLWLTPLRTPLAATGFTPHSLRLLGDALRHTGAVPVAGGGAAASVAECAKDAKLEPGGPLSVALITGDFDLSGIGTVTHIDGDRVYGWGHPFFGCGGCAFPMMTGYIHTVCPRQTVSFKMGSPLRAVGVIDADVSTCVAGRLHQTPDLIPVAMTVCRGGAAARTFHVQVVRQPAMVSSLVFTALTNAVDMEGDLPEELTAELRCTVELAGLPPVVFADTYSGSAVSGGRAPAALYNPVASVVNLLQYNAYKPVHINRIECETKLRPGRRTAEIDSVELDADTVAPGEPLRATVTLRPFRGPRQRVRVELPVPADLADGPYTATVCDGPSQARLHLKDHPELAGPQTVEQILAALRVQTAARRTELVLRVPTGPTGVALDDGRTLPDLPPGVAHALAQTRRSGAVAPVAGALVARVPTEWVVVGSEQVKFTVRRHKRAGVEE
jgi:hypothetical protein